MTVGNVVVVAVFAALGFAVWRISKRPGGEFAFGWNHPRITLMVFSLAYLFAVSILVGNATRQLPQVAVSMFRDYLVDVAAVGFLCGLVAMAALFAWRNPFTRDPSQIAANLRWGFKYGWVGLPLLPVVWLVTEALNPVAVASTGVPLAIAFGGFLAPWFVFGAIRAFFFSSNLPSLPEVAAAFLDDNDVDGPKQ